MERIRRRNSGYIESYDAGDDLENNNMYIIQINATSEKYVIGRPNVVNNQSQDHVVSPAFMIASQLGATPRISNATTAANHCGSYMEVGVDGTRYLNWRLPTREEIGIILGYQFSIATMEAVLTGTHYWTLEGAAVATGINASEDGIRPGYEGVYMDEDNDSGTGNIRCIRDLTEDDIKRLKAQQ